MFDVKNLENTLNSKNDLRKYFNQAKKLVYNYKPKNKKKEEFYVQQNIALANNSFDNRFLVVDMEWQFSQESIKETDDPIVKTRIDLVIVDTKPNELGINDIYLAELKVGIGATEGKSGIKDHIKNFKEITDKTEVCNDVKNDVESIIKNKSDLGLIGGKKKDLKLSDKPKMMLILAHRNKAEQYKLKHYANIAKNEAKKIGICEIDMSDPQKIDLQELFILKAES